MIIKYLVVLFTFISVIGILIYLNCKDTYILLDRKEKNASHLFVTAFFSFAKKKHSNNDYIGWMSSFFDVIKTSLVIFSDKESVKLIPSTNNKYVIVESIYTVPCIKKYLNVYKNQNVKDPEGKKVDHSMELYMVWNAKICLLNMATQMYNSSVYIWIDIGSFRKEYAYMDYPNMNVMNYLSQLNSMFFFVVHNQLFKKYSIPRLETGTFIEGGSFGGNKESITKFHDLFWKVHDEFLNKGEFIGKDQTLYNTIAVYYSNDIVLFPMYGYFKCWNNKWFRYINFYGGEACALLKEKNISSYLY